MYLRAALTAYRQLSANDGWAMASHVALSGLLALFPFLIFLTAVASFIGTRDLSETAVALLFSALPAAVASPLASEVHNVLTNQRGDLLTFGAVLALWFASSGVEALRVALNRAYDEIDERWFYITRVRALFFVFLGVAGLLVLAFMVVLGPSIWKVAALYVPELGAIPLSLNLIRYGFTISILFLVLVATHLWLPTGRRSFFDVLPGIVLTLVAWLIAAIGFAYYLTNFASYASTYAGFAGATIALVFLYFLSIFFVAGGEYNAAVMREGVLRTIDLKSRRMPDEDLLR
ncbi:MAG: YihY/virulence factor BrkB family protein [Beijerinckiaceae bacterium]|nr:YihY/virulence factor BrkB family protein [Beijerinckiaceae bacterium]